MKSDSELTALELSSHVMGILGKPVSADDIWSYAVDNNIATTLKGKTPARTIQAQLYVSIKKGDPTFCQVSRNPVLFYLHGKQIDSYESRDVKKQSVKCNERDLHPLLVSFVSSDPHFRCHCKTIKQEVSKKGPKNSSKWLHPDIVGVYFPFEDYNDITLDLFHTVGQSLFKLFSFEMK